jgi:hypothetical protein
MLAAPLPVGLNIVVPVVQVGGSPGLLPAALAFPLAFSGSAVVRRRLVIGMKSSLDTFDLYR